ncbi:MAG: hypothetical protein FWG87_10635 [Defluviitaleaceae bacterium]|nr:hypothetical protein [Defluviitaleaceae bacterium]
MTAPEKKHGTIRAATLKTLLKFIMDDFSVDENTALKMFYESHIGECFSLDESGLYGQSAVYIYSLFLENHQENQTKER